MTRDEAIDTLQLVANGLGDIAKGTTYQRTYLMCPNCGGQTESCVDHLKPGQKAGPWFHHDCGTSFLVSRLADGRVEAERFRETSKPVLVLLKLPKQSSDVYFVIGTHDIRGYAGISQDVDEQASARFLYEEHSCPTNWLRDVVLVAQDGDTDPHGFLEVVRQIDTPASVTGDLVGDAIANLFPELTASS